MTGVQTCALPILTSGRDAWFGLLIVVRLIGTETFALGAMFFVTASGVTGPRCLFGFYAEALYEVRIELELGARHFDDAGG